jgi:hypothetical protein
MAEIFSLVSPGSQKSSSLVSVLPFSIQGNTDVRKKRSPETSGEKERSRRASVNPIISWLFSSLVGCSLV